MIIIKIKGDFKIWGFAQTGRRITTINFSGSFMDLEGEPIG